jgi:hypothetical protein
MKYLTLIKIFLIFALILITKYTKITYSFNNTDNNFTKIYDFLLDDNNCKCLKCISNKKYLENNLNNNCCKKCH